jgi:hypothetical protein
MGTLRTSCYVWLVEVRQALKEGFKRRKGNRADVIAGRLPSSSGDILCALLTCSAPILGAKGWVYITGPLSIHNPHLLLID